MTATPWTIRPYAQPLAVPYRWAKGTQHARCGLLLRLEADGAMGDGEAAPPPHEVFDGHAFAAEAEALVAGLDPADDDFLAALDARRPTPRLRCGIAMAWLCWRAALAGRSLSAYLGAGRPVAAEVPINELITDPTPEGAVARVGEAWARGQTTVKMKCTDDFPLDLQRVEAIRAAFPEAAIRLDPNESWRLDDALERLRAFDAFGIDYIEQPVTRDVSLEDYAELRAASPIRIGLDDSVRSLADVDRIVSLGAADVLILKAQRLGGPDIALTVIDRAAAAGIDVTLTASIETAVGLTMNLHMAALAPQPIAPAGLGTARFFAQDVAQPPAIENGLMTVPTEPGLGVAWDPACVVP